MKILFLIQGFDTAASRYRVLQYLPRLEAEGVEAEVIVHPKNMREDVAQARSFDRYDAVFVQRRRLGAVPRWIARRTARHLVFDFDDAVMYRNSLAPSPFSRGRMRAFRKMAGLCHSIVVGNSFLLEETRPHTQAPILVIPTPIDMGSYSPKDHGSDSDGTVTIGWIGAHGSIHYLERLRSTLDRCYDEDPRLRLKIVCDTFFQCERMPVVEKPWRAEEEVEDLKSFDIGIMPLLDDPWSKGKCGLKILQCLGAGVPVVCTPVGINRDIVTEGVEGCHASTPDEWVEKLIRLARDPEARARMGEAGRKKVLDEYSVDACYPAFRQALGLDH